MTSPGAKLVMFTLAYHSGMGRVASELASAAAKVHDDVVLIAPAMEHEPSGVKRVLVARPANSGGRLKKLVSLIWMNISGADLVARTLQAGDTFVMIDLYSTVPVSVMPASTARRRGAFTVLNLHDFYPHAFRYPKFLRWLERFFFRDAYRKFDAIAATTIAQVELLTARSGIRRDRIAVVQHGAFPVANVVPPVDDAPMLTLLILGSLRRNKNVLESLLAVIDLQEKGYAIALRIAGAPRREEAAYWAKCQDALTRVRNLELTARYIDDHEMVDILSGVDAMLCPYEDFDSQSGISVTAVSNGIPLIATAAAGVADVAASPEMLPPISVPVTSDSIASAIQIFAAFPRTDRLARAKELQRLFLANSHWVKAVQTMLAFNETTAN